MQWMCARRWRAGADRRASALPRITGADLTSPSGKMTVGVLNAVVEFERDLLIERTQSGRVDYLAVHIRCYVKSGVPLGIRLSAARSGPLPPCSD
jgi:hypothetical protein